MQKEKKGKKVLYSSVFWPKLNDSMKLFWNHRIQLPYEKKRSYYLQQKTWIGYLDAVIRTIAVQFDEEFCNRMSFHEAGWMLGKHEYYIDLWKIKFYNW